MKPSDPRTHARRVRTGRRSGGGLGDSAGMYDPAVTDPIRSLPAPVLALAPAVRDAGGRALVVGGWVRDRLLGATRRTSTSRCSASRRSRSAAARSFGRVEAVGESFPVYKVGDIDVALPRRESKIRPRAQGIRRGGRSVDDVEEAARRRDFTINAMLLGPADRRDPRSVRRPRGPRRARAARRRCGTFGDDSLRVLRGLQFAARFELEIETATTHSAGGSRSTTCRPNAIWGEVEKLLLLARRPSIGFALALDLGVVAGLLPEMAGARRLPAGAGVASRRRRLGPHADGRRRGAARIDDLPRPRPRDHARRGVPRLRQAGDDRVPRRPHPIAGPRGRGRGAGARVPRSAEHPHASTATTCASRCWASSAQHLKPGMWYKVDDDGRRRRVPPPGAEGGPRAAGAARRADCPAATGRFDCAAMDWFLERARALGVEHRPPAPILLGPPPAGAGPDARARGWARS